jgi:excisionase family DNA binding protein
VNQPSLSSVTRAHVNGDNRKILHEASRSTVSQRFLSLQQTATYLGLSPKTLYVWAEKRLIPAYKLGRVWRFDREELEHFLKQRRHEAIL